MSHTAFFHRRRFLQTLSEERTWDVLVIGGGATGLGIAVDAAARGYATLLLEAEDFAKGTSSRSTKLIHGGVRYLEQGNIALVYEALHERGLLLQNAPHLVKRQSFIIPCYRVWEKIKYYTGLKVYDWLSGRQSLGSSLFLSTAEVKRRLPNLKAAGLKGGVEYYDAQFDDARLAVGLAKTCAEMGGALLNYCPVVRLLKDAAGKVTGVIARDREEGKEYLLQAKAVINATGVFAGDLLRQDEPGTEEPLKPSQGVHIVLHPSFLGEGTALLIPRTADGRVVFAVPWHGRLLAGTTDTPGIHYSSEPVALPEEIEFILQAVQPYLERPPGRKDILSVFAGLRPLAYPQKGKESTKDISREHRILTGASGLITITGGKWTTYRRMGQDAVDLAAKTCGLPERPCRTEHLRIHGYQANGAEDHLAVYGSDAEGIKELMAENSNWRQCLADHFPYVEAEVVWAVRHEMARTVEDVLARRLRLLFLDARAAIAASRRVAALMKAELGRDDEWEQEQVTAFSALARNYLVRD